MQTLTLALCLLAPQAAPPADPWETHLYNVEFLTRQVEDHPGTSLGLDYDAIGTMVVGTQFSKTLLTGEDLAELIKANVAEDGWEHVQAKIAYEAGILTVTNLKSVHEKIRQYLAYWRGFFAKMISVDAQILSVDPVLFARIRAAGDPERPMVIPAEPLRTLQAAALEGALAERLQAFRVIAHPGQRVNLQDLFKQAYLRDHDVQIAGAAGVLDPIMDVVSSGTSLDVTPFLEPFGNAVSLEVYADRADLEGIVEKKLHLARELSLAVQREGKEGESLEAQRAMSRMTEVKLELPRLALDRVRTTLTLRGGETGVAGAVLRGGRQVVFLLTPNIIRMEENPAPEPAFEEQRVLRIYDVSPLTRRIRDWSAPRIGLNSPSSGFVGPLTGATFSLEEPAALMSEESVVALIKTRVAPETWGNKRNRVDSGPGGILLVRQKPEVLRQLDLFLSTLLFARAQMISVEAVLISFRRGAKAEWERTIPSLGPGGHAVDTASFDRLFAEACRNGNVRLLEAGELSCFPQEQVYVAKLRQEAAVQDFEPQVSSAAAIFDPIVGIHGGGFVLEARPAFVHGQEQIAVALRVQQAIHETRDLDLGAPSPGPLQPARGPEGRWSADVLCRKGTWAIVAVQTRGKGADAEDLVLLLRARGNRLAP
jgi:hypothetical protein